MQCQLHWSSNDGDVWVHVTSNYFLKYFLFEKTLIFFLKKLILILTHQNNSNIYIKIIFK